MKTNLTYFRWSGKYYSVGDYITEENNLHKIWEEVERMMMDKTLPGLVKGHSNYHVLVDVPEHPHNHPHLIPAYRVF